MSITTDTMIGKFFRLKHLIWSNTAKNNGINNFPGVDSSPSQSEIIANLEKLMINIIDPIVLEFPDLIISSGYRCKKLNDFIGGSNTSQHMFGQAIDIQVPGVPTSDLYNYIFSNIKGWDQLIWEYPEKGKNSWVHVSYSSQNRKKTTLASNDDVYHNLYNGERYGSTNQYQHGINNAKIV
tara:strand:- start:754 stop:1296 length:543 start_codon:yes stop_codon:yes gene_type:complete